jgi:hypothetical protein
MAIDNQEIDFEKDPILEEEDDSTEEDDDKGDSSTEDDDKDDDKDKGGEEGKDFEIPEKFKGKELKDVIKSYTELEQLIEKKAMQKAIELSGKNNVKPVTKKEKDELAEELSKIDFSKMKPAEFAKYILEMSEKRAQEISRKTYDTVDQTKATVAKDIDEAQKVWPQLKENEGFKEMVIALIENSANAGKILPLKEACERVGKAMNLKQGETTKTEVKPVVRPKTGVERTSGGGGTEKQTDEEAVVAGILGAGSNSPHKLGGLGI